MKLKRLIVKNFRGLIGEENIIDFENSDIIFLIGKNNNGKSTFLHAYDFFVNPKMKAIHTDFHNCNGQLPIEIIGEFKVDKTIDSKDKLLNKDDPEWIDKWVDKNGIIKIKKEWTSLNSEGQKLTFDPVRNDYAIGGFGGFDTLLKKYAPTSIFINAITTPDELEKSINEIIAKEHIKKLETQYSERYEALVNDLSKLKEEISKAKDISEINKKMNTIFSNVFPDLKAEIYSAPDAGIDISKTLKSSHGVKVLSKFDNENSYEFDFKSNGHGVIRQILFSYLSTLSANLDSTTKEYLILFEEPELYLHPNAIRALRNQLYSLASNSPFQILCATHSALMIDTSKPHSSLVRLEKKPKGITKTYQVNFDIFHGDEKNTLQMINRFNPHVCESFYNDEIILVEGDTEAIIYRELISRFYSNNYDMYVLNTGSKANMVFYSRILTHFGIKHVIVHDVDSQYVKDHKGKDIVNSMWTFNERIWEQVENANKVYKGIARRFVHNRNFEEAHNYIYNSTKGKPLSAFEYANNLVKDLAIPCFIFLEDYFENKNINITQDILLKM